MKKAINVLNWIVILAFTGLYVSLIFNQNIVTDEAYTLRLINGGIKEIVEGTASDVHPPLYYFWAKLFQKLFGYSWQVQKIATIIPMTSLMVFSAIVIKKYFGDLTAFLFNLFVACIPCSMEFAVQIRMYSLCICFVTVCGVYAYAAFRDGKWYQFLFMGAAGVISAYLHYFAFAPIIIVNGFLMIAILIGKRKLIIKWIVTSIGMIALYLPWMPYFITQVTRVEGGYWIPPVTWQTTWKCFTWAFDLELIPGTVYGFLGILVILGIYNIVLMVKEKKSENVAAFLFMLIPALTWGAGTVLSIIKTPIYRDQYIFPSLGLLGLFFAINLSKSKNVFVILVSVFLIFVGVFQYKEEYAREYTSTLTPKTLEFLAQNCDEDDIILYNYQTFDFIYKCYFPERLYHLSEWDFTGAYDVVWYLHTPWYGDVQQAYIDFYQLEKEYMGDFGIEQNKFEIYKIYRKNQ